MDLDNLIIKVFCSIDDAMKQILINNRLRSRGPNPILSDSEVLTMEVVGEFLSLGQDIQIFRYFQHHYSHFFPAIGRIHRTTFTRQAANLCQVKEKVWQHLLTLMEYDHALAIVDSFPIHACYFARSSRCQRFKGEAAYGRDNLVQQTFYGFRIHVHLNLPGVITRFALTPANVHENKVVRELVEDTCGFILGDRNYWSPILREELREEGIVLEAPFRKASRDPWSKRSKFISRIRFIIETVFSQLTVRYQIKKVWARDRWHLCSRLLRKILSHTLCLMLNQLQSNPPLRLASLLI